MKPFVGQLGIVHCEPPEGEEQVPHRLHFIGYRKKHGDAFFQARTIIPCCDNRPFSLLARFTLRKIEHLALIFKVMHNDARAISDFICDITDFKAFHAFIPSDLSDNTGNFHPPLVMIYFLRQFRSLLKKWDRTKVKPA